MRFDPVNSPAGTAAPISLGYVDPSAYLALNAWRNARDPARAFCLDFALQHWRARFPTGVLRQHLGSSPRCLIQGCASADNADALRVFLQADGITAPDIHVIDLIELSAFWPITPSATFHRADAANLAAVFPDASFDLVVQDHLLNCAPFSVYSQVLGELRRILTPNGIALLHYTDPSAFPRGQGEAFRDRISACPGAAHVRLAPGEAETLSRAGAALRLVTFDARAIMVTLPAGNLEFFIPFGEFQDLVRQSGLDLRQSYDLHITDSEELPCRRHHCLIAHQAR